MIRNATFSRLLLALGAAGVVLAAGCGKKENATEPVEKQAATTPEKAADKPAETEPAETEPAKAEPAKPATEDGDFIKIYGAHEPTTEADPVELVVGKYTIKSAEFDPEDLEGGTAEIEIDLSSLKSDKDKRDAHLKSPDYLDVAKFAVATIKLSDVEGAGDKDYKAKAEVSAHGVTKTIPVTFTVLEATDDAIRISGEHTFDRLDFGIGSEPDGENEKVAKEVTIKMQLTLENS